MTQLSAKLAKLVKAAIEAREDSYDQAAAEVASEQSIKAQQAEPDNLYAGFVDYGRFYRKTLREACQEVCSADGEHEMGEVVYFLLAYVWNDIDSWAIDNCPADLL